MKSKLTLPLMIGISILSFSLLPGCYTQLAVTREEQNEGQPEYTAQNQVASDQYIDSTQVEEYSEGGQTVINNYYPDSYPHRIGFGYYYPSYYWPSYAFSVAYNDPWFYDSYWAYDPWWCGSPYISYGGWGYSGWDYYPGYYYPHNGYWDDHNYATTYKPRTSGVTRGGGTRGATGRSGYDTPTTLGSDRSTFNLPTGRAVDRGTAGTGRTNPATNKGTVRKEGSQRVTTPRSGDTRTSGNTNQGSRGSSSRSGNNRGNRTPQYTPDRYIPPPTYNPPRSGDSGTRSTGTSRGSTPTYTPPPSRAPSSPARAPAQSSGSGRTGGGRR